jgi:asparagine synthase (glutamine-hydrolysing)
MCGIGAILSLDGTPVPELDAALGAMNALQAHRGPDGAGTWIHPAGHAGLAHRRLSVIDLEGGAQPMDAGTGAVISYNGEIYNYRELRSELGAENFRTASDTEVILRAYERWGPDCVRHFRGMFAFALWDDRLGQLFCARDHFGIKPLYYTVQQGVLYLASEAKALLPFLPAIETDPTGLRDYLAFQFCLDGKTLFRGIRELAPGHVLTADRNGHVRQSRYWEVFFELDFGHTERWFRDELRGLTEEAVALNLRSDVPLGAYISGGMDSGVVAALAARSHDGLLGYCGRFAEGRDYDESAYARQVAAGSGIPLAECTISAEDFIGNIGAVIYHLDTPTAGPGAFSQYMISRRVRQDRKVVLGGQGGDEIFGGYARYLIAYFEQCIKAAIDGTMHDGNFIVTYESIIPALASLRQYKPLLQDFWRDGLFDDMDRRYFRLVHRARDLEDEVAWDALGSYSPFDAFCQVFHAGNVRREAYFDLMTHFDFKTLLPALLQVEDRASMAHGLESRVPLLDHRIVEFAASVPPDIKFHAGEMKRVFKLALGDLLPAAVRDRTDKMGFPTPFTEWSRGPAREFIRDTLSSGPARTRPYIRNERVLRRLDREPRFGRALWGFLSLELWQQAFHDRARELRETASGRRSTVDR